MWSEGDSQSATGPGCKAGAAVVAFFEAVIELSGESNFIDRKRGVADIAQYYPHR